MRDRFAVIREAIVVTRDRIAIVREATVATWDRPDVIRETIAVWWERSVVVREALSLGAKQEQFQNPNKTSSRNLPYGRCAPMLKMKPGRSFLLVGTDESSIIAAAIVCVCQRGQL